MRIISHRVWYEARRMARLLTMIFAVIVPTLLVSIQPVAHDSRVSFDDTWLYLLGGFGYQEFLSLDHLVAWLLLLLPFLAAVVVPMQTEYDGRCRETLYRYARYRQWYATKVLASILVCVVITICELLGVLLGSALWGVTTFRLTIRNAIGFNVSSVPALTNSALLLCTYSMMLIQFMMVIHLLTGSSVLAVLAFTLPPTIGIYSGSSITSTLSPLNNPLNWGMLARSKMMHEPGFALSTAYWGLFCLALLFAIAGVYAAKRVRFAIRIPKT